VPLLASEFDERVCEAHLVAGLEADVDCQPCEGLFVTRELEQEVEVVVALLLKGWSVLGQTARSQKAEDGVPAAIARRVTASRGCGICGVGGAG